MVADTIVRRGLLASVSLLTLCSCGGRQADDTSEHGESSESSDDADMAIDEMEADLEMLTEAAISTFAASAGPDELHVCPHPPGSTLGGSSGVTPSLAVDPCCTPVTESGGAGTYPITDWTNNPVWAGLGFVKTEPHVFHYNFIASNDLEGYGACSFTAQAFGDLDHDTIFSTYERRGHVDENGSVVEALFVNLPYE